MSSLQVKLLGTPDPGLPSGGKSRPTGKQLALLYYLALKNRPVAKAELAELLWDGKRNNLRVALHRLRALPGADEWLLDEHDLGLDCSSDLVEFQTHHDEGDPGLALAVWERASVAGSARGALLEGFALRNSPVFQDWLEIERRRVEGLYLECLQRHAAVLAQARRFDEALARWRQLLREDSLHEGAHREAMRLEWLRGNRAAALEQYATCRRVLRAELGLEPLEETVELYEQIRDSSRKRTRSQSEVHQGKRSEPRAEKSPFIGRERELALLGEFMSERRIVTISGPGGAGKTRLAERAAAQHGCRFSHGTAAVYLADLGSHDFLVPSIGAALGLDFAGHAAPTAQLLDFVRDKRMLLVVDNMEHLLSGVGILQELLDHAPGLVLLVTSREPLEIPGEAVLPLAGLPWPEEGAEQRAEKFDAVRLFVTQAHRVEPTFRLGSENRGQVAHICRLVDGLPLAIELAASWVRSLSLDELAHDLMAGLEKLRRAQSSGTADTDTLRRQSMGAAIEHSWQLLGDSEREGLAAASLFRGGFERDAAAFVAGIELRTLLALVNKSLVIRTGSGRFGLLEVIRRFAAQKLAASPQRGELEMRHVDHFSARTAELGPLLRSSGQAEALATLTEEAQNVRLAWQNAARLGRWGCLEQMLEGFFEYERLTGIPQRGERSLADAVAALSAPAVNEAASLRSSISARRAVLLTEAGNYQEAEDLLRRSLASALEAGDAAEAAFCRAALAENALRRGDPVGAEEWAEAALQVPAIARGDEAKALLAAGAALGQRGELAAARQRFESALEIHRSTGDSAGAVQANNSLGVAAGTAGEFETARAHFEQSLAGARAVGDRRSAANALGNLGMAAVILEEFDEARRCFEESLALRRELGSRPGLVDCLTDLGILALESDRLEEARERFAEAVTLARQLDNPQKLALALNNLGLSLARLDEFEPAHSHLAEALSLNRAAGLVQAVLSALTGFGHLFALCGRARLSVVVLTFVLADERTPAEARMTAEQLLGEAEGALGAEGTAEARDEAQVIGLDELSELVLGVEAEALPAARMN